MGSVPMALIGAVFLLAVSGTSINLVALIGMIVLAGIAANDAIVKVDFILRMRRGGMSLHESVLEAGKLRFRPIFMTTATLIFGLLPMALFVGSGGQLQHPLALAILGGIVTSTILTLFVIPVLYTYIDRFLKIQDTHR
jgi:hydrophobic/amphiphilic exporter-1 (mainly G- bacteria), HAE1 family